MTSAPTHVKESFRKFRQQTKTKTAVTVEQLGQKPDFAGVLTQPPRKSIHQQSVDRTAIITEMVIEAIARGFVEEYDLSFHHHRMTVPEGWAAQTYLSYFRGTQTCQRDTEGQLHWLYAELRALEHSGSVLLPPFSIGQSEMGETKSEKDAELSRMAQRVILQIRSLYFWAGPFTDRQNWLGEELLCHFHQQLGALRDKALPV